ncbi:hypothetical protein MKY59_20270 [Paenibacillus sp. FSL W8-0426]|uniref:hypothetical protein n=1 Tax=Paenibacillus sp. FSL W8-0426 TaxID=2921714 RepID=UPI0030D7A02A
MNLIKELLPQYPEIVHTRIRIDDTGVGGGVTDRLNEVIAEEGLPYEVIPINNGSSSLDEHYENLGAEMWAYIKGQLEQNMSNYMNGIPAVLQLPSDDVLISQLTTRKWSMTSKGKILLESKKDMKKRGLKSPDRADAYVLTFGEYLIGSPQPIMFPTNRKCISQKVR